MKKCMYKCRSIETLLQKSLRLCSNYENIQRKIKTLKSIFKQKNYPQNFENNSINKLLNKLFIQKDLDFAIPKTKLTPKKLVVNLLPPQPVWMTGWNPSFLWVLILSLITSFLKISLKLLKSFRRYEDFLCQHCLLSSTFISFLDCLTFSYYK